MLIVNNIERQHWLRHNSSISTHTHTTLCLVKKLLLPKTYEPNISNYNRIKTKYHSLHIFLNHISFIYDMKLNLTMDLIIILCIITCTNLLFLKVSSLERQHLPEYNVDQGVENSIAYVLDYCNKNLESKRLDTKDLINASESRYLNNFNFTVNLCRLVRNATIHHQGTKL